MPQTHIDTVRHYLKSIERGDWEAARQGFAAHAVQIEQPNRLKPGGDRRTLDQMAADFEKGKTLLVRQTYEIRAYAETPSFLMAEVTWRGTLAIPVGDMEAGDEMVAHSALAFSFEDGKIVSQRNYDCFEPF